MLGQAKRLFELRSLFDESNPKINGAKIISISSGKGGTGKSFVAGNIAGVLSNTGRKVLLIDLDINFANLSTMLNVNSKENIYHFLTYNKSLSDIIIQKSNNLNLILGESGKTDHPKFSYEKSELFINELKIISTKYDFIIIDTASGIDSGSLNVLTKSDEIILVTTPEPTSVMDGYVILKMLRSNGTKKSVSVIVNKCLDENDAQNTFENLDKAAKHFLKEKLSFIGKINFSEEIIRSIQSQSILQHENKDAEITRQFEKISNKLNNTQMVNNNQPEFY